MITLKFPLGRKPTPEEWRRVWAITGIPPNTGSSKWHWRIKVGEAQYAEVLAYLQALALDSGFTYTPPPAADGWQPWSGGERPVPARCLVEYKDLSGRVFSKGDRNSKLQSHKTCVNLSKWKRDW